jgi:Tat protein secretion system quality control protein TatD with DNase activity
MDELMTEGNQRTLRKTCPSATLYTTNLRRTNLRSIPGLSSERPETNRLSHDTAFEAQISCAKHYNIQIVLHGKHTYSTI